MSDEQPIVPTPGTIEFQALRLLQEHGSLTHLQFQVATGSYRLAASIRQLRLKRWPILTVRIDSGRRNSIGNPIKHARYILSAAKAVQ